MARHLLGFFRPPKPLSEMTEEEEDAYIGAVAAVINARLAAFDAEREADNPPD